MLKFIDKNLLPNEIIVFRTQKHFIVFVIPCLFLLVSVFFITPNFITTNINQVYRGTAMEGKLNYLGALVFFIAAVFWFLKQGLLYFTSDYAVTNQRVLVKEGFFNLRTFDTRLRNVAHVSVAQSFVGQLLNYGTIIVTGFGGSADYFIQVLMPNEFKNAVHEQLNSLDQK